LLLLASTLYLLAGETSPIVHVRILDPSQRPVPHAKITILSKANIIFQGTSGETGEVSAPMGPGRYQVDVQCDGFNEQRSVLTVLKRDQKIAISLSIRKETVSVTVSDQATKLDTASDSHQDLLKLKANDLANLPIRDGDFISALSFFTNPAGGSPTIIVDGMERTDSVSLTLQR
jgi:hypothetical protein